MKKIGLGRGHLDLEHEGERFRLLGELGSDSFIAWLSGIEHLTSEKQTVSLPEQEQLRVMLAVKEYWDNEFPIVFIDDEYNLL